MRVAVDSGTLACVSSMMGLGLANLGVGSNRVDIGGSRPCVTDVSNAPGASCLNPDDPRVGGGNHVGEVPEQTIACQLAPHASVPQPTHQDGESRVVHPRAATGASHHRRQGHQHGPYHHHHNQWCAPFFCQDTHHSCQQHPAAGPQTLSYQRTPLARGPRDADRPPSRAPLLIDEEDGHNDHFNSLGWCQPDIPDNPTRE
jgi:hypothetical protein